MKLEIWVFSPSVTLKSGAHIYAMIREGGDIECCASGNCLTEGNDIRGGRPLSSFQGFKSRNLNLYVKNYVRGKTMRDISPGGHWPSMPPSVMSLIPGHPALTCFEFSLHALRSIHHTLRWTEY